MQLNFFINLLFQNPEAFALISILVIFSICLHEYMHARVALSEGDPTAADAGHLTLNPLKQMGVMSLVMFFMIGLAWGQVPVNPARMRRKHSPALVAAAGPLVNLVLFLVFTAVFACCIKFQARPLVSVMFYYGATLNAVLFLLNMLPIPGLDGWTVLTNFCPRIDLRNNEWIKGISLALLLGVVMGAHYLFFAGSLAVAACSSLLLRVIG